MLTARALSRQAFKICKTTTTRKFVRTPQRYTEDVRVVEVGPRDGLQNEKIILPLETKLKLIQRLAQTGLGSIEAGAFVSSKLVPQMRHSSEILRCLLHHPPAADRFIAYNFLVPTERHLKQFLQDISSNKEERPKGTSSSTADTPSATSMEISVFAAATESFSRANINCSIAESMERFRPVLSQVKAHKIRARGYVSVALGCPYEGPNVDPGKVAEVAATLLEMGVDEVSVADTTGMGTAPRTRELLRRLSAAGIANHDLALHFHDTYGQALVNTIVALEHGVRTFDGAVGGLGGCPFANGATGNVATEDLVYCLHSLGLQTGVDGRMIAEIGAWISKTLGRDYQSRAGKAIFNRLKANC